ncbi:MAG: hypothetical protein ACRDIX_00680 [Actinomycetota bacterium]
MSGAPVHPGAFFLLLALTLVGAVPAAALLLAGEDRAAGAAAVAAGVALVAASTGAGGVPRFVLLHAVAERLIEAVILGAIAWVALPEQPRLAGAAVLALGASYLAAYLRVRSEGLGFRVTVPVALRAAPPFLVALGLLVGTVEVALWAVVLLSALVVAMAIAELGRQREPR